MEGQFLRVRGLKRSNVEDEMKENGRRCFQFLRSALVVTWTRSRLSGQASVRESLVVVFTKPLNERTMPNRNQEHTRADRQQVASQFRRPNALGIVRHSTLWLRPRAVAQIEFLEWSVLQKCLMRQNAARLQVSRNGRAAEDNS
jgi:hypothetical protein